MDGREAEAMAEKFFREIEVRMEDIDDEEEIRGYIKMILNMLLGKCDAIYDIMKAQREAQAEAEEIEEVRIPFFWDIKWSKGRSMFERKR